MRRVFATALLAGLIAGLFVTVVQELRVVPLILAAEGFEAPTAHAGHAASEPWSPAEGLERRAFTLIANMVMGTGFALLLTALFALRGRDTDWRLGLAWGLGGFVAFSLAPSLGLPPALPGTAEGDLGARQLWWILTALATAGGIACLAYRRGWAAAAAGIALVALPHLIGAPHGDGGEGSVPPGLAMQFVVASLLTAAAFWAVLGALTGHFFRRLS